MSNFECTVTIADIYGAEWWERNKEELEREWEWEFRIKGAGDRYAMANPCGIAVGDPTGSAGKLPRIILRRRKPKPPTLREVYGVDEVKIPVGWEWTGERRKPEVGDSYVSYGSLSASTSTDIGDFPSEQDIRLILRKRAPKVWFKAEEKARCPKAGDYIWTSHRDWAQAEASLGIYLCATRHEEIDSTVQVVTQAMVEEGVKV